MRTTHRVERRACCVDCLVHCRQERCTAPQPHSLLVDRRTAEPRWPRDESLGQAPELPLDPARYHWPAAGWQTEQSWPWTDNLHDSYETQTELEKSRVI